MGGVDDALYLNTYRIESTRLQEWGYDSPSLYFVTICTKIRRPWPGFVKGETIPYPGSGTMLKRLYILFLSITHTHMSIPVS